ncbi:hypothetical protein VULLAG_LOCUS9370 [Vulpes lagopus]
MAMSLAQCLGHMKYNMADVSHTLLMLLEAENTQCPGLGAWLTLLGQEWGFSFEDMNKPPFWPNFGKEGPTTVSASSFLVIPQPTEIPLLL